MASHSFNFEGGEILTGMGASWFVSYAYYENLDPAHKNWSRVPTVQARLSRYNRGRIYHEAWLQQVLKMNPDNLEKNTIGLSARTVKRMAKEILDRWHHKEDYPIKSPQNEKQIAKKTEAIDPEMEEKIGSICLVVGIIVFILLIILFL